MPNPNAQQQPWHGLPLFFANQNPFVAAKGLAIAHVFAQQAHTPPTPHAFDWPKDEIMHQHMWQAYGALMGADTPLGEGSSPPFTTQDQWLPCAASSLALYSGGYVLAQTLHQFANMQSLASTQGTLQTYAPKLAARPTQQTGFKLAALALHLWHQQWQKKAPVKTDPVFQAFLNALSLIEAPDFATLPPPLLVELTALHTAWVLCLGVQNTGVAYKGLVAATEYILPPLQGFKAQRYNGLGQLVAQTLPFTPLGYGPEAGEVFNTLMAENVWLPAMPIYAQGAFLEPPLQAELAQTRRQLEAQLNQAFTFSAYQNLPSDHAYVAGQLSKKQVLETLIAEATA